MSVVLWVYGNHSIAFKGKEIANKGEVLDKLDSLKLEESAFLLEMCKNWNTLPWYIDEWDFEIQKKLERDLQIRSWDILREEEDYYPHTNKYAFMGPYGLEIEITKHYIFISPWISRYHFWYDVTGEENIRWRDTWRLLIYQIIQVLGGDSALYFPDNMSDLSCYLPIEHKMPEFNRLIRKISKEYAAPITHFATAAKLWIEDKLDKDPFVIDKFEDIQSMQLK